MNNELLSLPGYRQCDYQLVLMPHEELFDRIMKVKKDFAEKFHAPSAQYGRPYIQLVSFSQLQIMEERLCNRLKLIAMAMPAFKIELKDFGTVPSHTLFINVDSRNAVNMLVKSLKPAQRLMKMADTKPHFISDPYIAVARKLQPWQFEQASKEYGVKHFSGRFIANKMLLLRKVSGAKTYQAIAHFEFLNMPVVTQQGALF